MNEAKMILVPVATLDLALERAFDLGQLFKLQCEQARWYKGSRELADETKMVFKQLVENTLKEEKAQPEQEPVADVVSGKIFDQFVSLNESNAARVLWLDEICQDLQEKTYNQAMRIAELEAQLAQQELCKYGQEPKSCTSSPIDCQCALDATFAQPEQEPTKLWCETCEGSGEVYQEHQAGCHVGGNFKCPDCDGYGYVISRLYSTTPPQRKPLTDEQKCVECFAYGGHHRLGCIKAAHGIK